MNLGIKRPRPAMVIAVIALIIALTGTAMAALSKNSVGSRQLKSKSVKTAKFADGSVTSGKVAKATVTGKNVDANKLGTVPTAVSATSASDAGSVNSHPASCPQGTTLIRGLCFDSSSNGPILGVKAAADACAARGGKLPTQQLFSVRSVIDLGDGTGSNAQFADSYFYDGFLPYTIVVYSTDLKIVQDEEPKDEEVLANFEYICSYQLIR